MIELHLLRQCQVKPLLVFAIAPLHRVACLFEQQMRLDPCQHNGRTDGLGDVVGRAQLEPQLLILRLRLRGEKNHRYVGSQDVGFEPPTNLIAIQVGHHDVQQNQVRRLGMGNFERALAIGCQFDGVVGFQQVAHQRQILRSVIHHQNRRALGQFVGGSHAD